MSLLRGALVGDSPLWIIAVWAVALTGAAFVGFARSRRDLVYVLLWLQVGWLVLVAAEHAWTVGLEVLALVALVGVLWTTRDPRTMTPVAVELRAATTTTSGWLVTRPGSRPRWSPRGELAIGNCRSRAGGSWRKGRRTMAE
ncbi:MAG: hypothetical protein GEU78_17565 [Actinobacteria bacterium]|nr:hypothetical protein [Actinomycetota bacterium]